MFLIENLVVPASKQGVIHPIWHFEADFVSGRLLQWHGIYFFACVDILLSGFSPYLYIETWEDLIFAIYASSYWSKVLQIGVQILFLQYMPSRIGPKFCKLVCL